MVQPIEPRGGVTRRFDVGRPIALAAAVLEELPGGGLGLDAHPDAPLLAACRGYVGLQQRKERLSADDTARTADHARRSRFMEALTRRATAILARVAELRATSLDGHRARAAAFLAWDDGDLMGRADELGFTEDRLLAALILDLTSDGPG